jgi:hypothetical protein
MVPGLEGAIGFFLLGLAFTCRAGLEEGISSQASPAMVSSFMKNGHNFARIERDSFASAEDIGTGDDLMIAVATSDVGNVRRFRDVRVVEEVVVGVEKSLESNVRSRATCENKSNRHPNTLCHAAEAT